MARRKHEDIGLPCDAPHTLQLFLELNFNAGSEAFALTRVSILLSLPQLSSALDANGS